jgi:hypothetical protein
VTPAAASNLFYLGELVSLSEVWETLLMPAEPDTLGKGIGPFLSDYLPLLPSGARRAGAARVMAERIGRDPSWILEHPLKSQIIASGLGSATIPLTKGIPREGRIGIAVAPFLLLQGLKRREIKKIQKEYDEKDRKRLRELDTDGLFDAGPLGLGGSSRLGAVQAYETMRDRKFKNLNTLSELGDVVHLGTSAALGPLGPYAAIPITSAIDNQEADRLSKSASFYDQQNNPALPLYLAAAGASGLGMLGASLLAKHEMGNTDPLGTRNWGKMIHDISGSSPMLFETQGRDNGFYYKPRTMRDAEQFLIDMQGTGAPRGNLALRKLLNHGAIVADSDAGAPMIAHEAGHAKIENTPGAMQFLQRHLYPHSRWLAPLAGAGSMAAGLHSGSAGKGALLGTGIGALAGLGTVAPEIGASYHALKHLHGKGDGKMTAEGWKDLLSAISTYLAGTVLPSTLAGAAGGHLSAKRREREKRANKAVIVKGNPRYIEGNPKAEAFYKELEQLVRDAGYEPSFDAGEPHTVPDEDAALWVGHSRGQDRLRLHRREPRHSRSISSRIGQRSGAMRTQS